MIQDDLDFLRQQVTLTKQSQPLSARRSIKKGKQTNETVRE